MYDIILRVLRNIQSIFEPSVSNVMKALHCFARVRALLRFNFLSTANICFSIAVFVPSPPRLPAAMSAASASS